MVSSSCKGDFFLTIYDEEDPRKFIPIMVKNAEGVPNQTDVLFSLPRILQAGGVMHLEEGKCSLTLAGQTIRIRDDCQLRSKVVMPKAASENTAWMTVGKGGGKKAARFAPKQKAVEAAAAAETPGAAAKNE